MNIAKNVAQLVASCCAIFAVAACATVDSVETLDAQSAISSPATPDQQTYSSDQTSYLPATDTTDDYSAAKYKASPKSSYKGSGSVYVKSYTRKDGTRVSAHTRSRARR